MENRLAIFDYLNKRISGTWGRRIICELGYLLEISALRDYQWDDRLSEQLNQLKSIYEETGAITKSDAEAVECALKDFSAEAKSYEVTCVSHAHMDVNWMWGYNETASATIDTFATMLQLMKEYPDFVFTQSQAELYHIVEEYAPYMLPEIKERVREGRWEVAATSWVENDKNMTGAEAMARQILYTKQYLSNLLDISADTLTIDFEPDTFGHCNMLPEILNQGGIRYYYHCRGYDGHYIYRWKAPSGASVLTYREPKWYAQEIVPELFLHVPDFCAQYGIKDYLKVYGVGDHGGGPTRRDIERLIDMNQWPLYPTIHFGRLDSFFQKLERNWENFPEVDRELNFIFTGCYTSQGRIKRANRIAEDRAYESEMLDVMANVVDPDYKTASPFQNAWHRIMNNQFHDTLPGSGVAETREFAMGEFQRAMATLNINANHAMRTINQKINTSDIQVDNAEDTAMGAGVGYGSRDYLNYKFPVAESGCGNKRIYTLFNTTQWKREDLTEIALWDWQGQPENIRVLSADNRELPVQVLSNNVTYWSHKLSTLLVKAKIPAFGYTTIVLDDKGVQKISSPNFSYPRNDYITDENIVLENEKLKVVFDSQSMMIISMMEKQTGRELVDPLRPAGGLHLITESTKTEMVTEAGQEDMSAWRMGKYGADACLNEVYPVTIHSVSKGSLRQKIGYSIAFENSTVNVTISLDMNVAMLRYDVMLHWREFGSKAKGVPLLTFSVPLAEKTPISKCSVPFGILPRPAQRQDVPCNGMMSVMQGERAVAIVSDCKYGFRNDGHGMTLSLLRAPFNPDSTPDIGNHIIAFAIAVGEDSNTALISLREQFAHPICFATNTVHTGELPQNGELFSISGAQVTGVKQAEDGNGLIVRLYNPDSKQADVQMQMCKDILYAQKISVTEEPVRGHNVSTEKRIIRLCLDANKICSIRIVM